MKFCTICDRPLTGTWCKSCKKFVKTYDISNDVHLNQSHDLENDAGCTYHTTSTTNGTVGSTQTNRSYTSVESPSGQTPKKSSKKLVGIIIGAYVLMMICVAVVTMLAPFATDSIKKSKQEKIEEIEELSLEEQQELLNREKRNTLLMELTPESVVETEEYEIRYFTFEDIEGIGYPCDSSHLAMDLDAFEKWLLSNAEYGLQFSESSSSNYYNIHEDSSYASFSCYRDYDGFDDFSIWVSYDTATKQLHQVRFTTDSDDMNLSSFESFVKKFEPGTEWSEEQIAKDVEAAKKAEGSVTLYYLNQVRIDFQMNKDGYSLIYYSVR